MRNEIKINFDTVNDNFKFKRENVTCQHTLCLFEDIKALFIKES